MSVYKIFSNNTLLNGTLIRLPVSTDDVSQTTNPTVADDNYDAIGAMQFIVATVLVYSIFGVFCTLILRIKRIRGKSHENYIQDESVVRYLKSENVLKMDGRKTKMLQECNSVADQIKLFEERQKFIGLEKELSDFYAYPTHDIIERKSKKKKHRKKERRERHDFGSTIGKMGVSLLYMGNIRQMEGECSSQSDVGHGIELHTNTQGAPSLAPEQCSETETNNINAGGPEHNAHSKLETDL